MLGPPVAGVLIATVGLPVTFGVDAATFMVSLTALSLMNAVPPPPGAERVSVRAMLAGVRYAAGRRDLLGSYLVDMNAMFFGMPMALFPQIAAGFGGPAVLGLLYTGPAVGSLLASLVSGWTRLVRHHGRAIACAAAAWGVAIIGFGFPLTCWEVIGPRAVGNNVDVVAITEATWISWGMVVRTRSNKSLTLRPCQWR